MDQDTDQTARDAAARRASAAVAAAAAVEDGMVLGLGTGRTAEAFLAVLAERVAAGLAVTGVPTSERTRALAASLAIPLTDLDRHPRPDLAVDGADEIDGALRLIKGGGGALLREKIVAAAADAMLVVADASKRVAHLGAFPLPIEIVAFGARATIRHIEGVAGSLGLAGALVLRQAGDGPFRTDGGNHIVDASFGRLDDPEALAATLSQVPGVVEHGLFLDMASRAVIAGSDGIRWYRR